MASPARRTFTEEFKQKAVERVLAGEGLTAVANDLKITHSVLWRWKAGYKAPKVAKEPKAKRGNPGLSKPLVMYLRQADRLIMAKLASGTRPDELDLLMLLCLREAEK